MSRPAILLFVLISMATFASPLQAVSACPGLCQYDGTVCVKMYITTWQCWSIEVMGSTLCTQRDDPCYLSAEESGDENDVRLAENGSVEGADAAERTCTPLGSENGLEIGSTEDSRSVEVGESLVIPARS